MTASALKLEYDHRPERRGTVVELGGARQAWTYRSGLLRRSTHARSAACLPQLLLMHRRLGIVLVVVDLLLGSHLGSEVGVGVGRKASEGSHPGHDSPLQSVGGSTRQIAACRLEVSCPRANFEFLGPVSWME